MNKKLNFTKADIEALPLPKKRTYYRDEKEKGLVLDVRPSGSKSFYLYKKIDGKPERILIGNYPDIKIPEARNKCAVLKGQIANGKNPQNDKRDVRQEITFGAFFQEYMERYSKPYKKSWMYDEREVSKFLSHWLKRKMSNITKQEVKKLHDEIGIKNGVYQGNRILERVRGIYSKAIEWGWDGENPATGIKKFKEKARDRFIQPNEMPLLMHALEIEENKTARDYILISLMTGARKSNVLAMRWEHVNWEQRQWRIPETKNGDPITILLVPQALEILKNRKLKTNSEWVFAGKGKNGYLADPKKTWDRVRQRATIELWMQEPRYTALIKETDKELEQADNYGFTVLKRFKAIQAHAERKGFQLPTGLADIRLHDLRRTFGSYQAMTGASLPIIGKTLGHKSQQSTSIYARLHDDPVRASMEKATEAMFGFRKDD